MVLGSIPSRTIKVSATPVKRNYNCLVEMKDSLDLKWDIEAYLECSWWDQLRPIKIQQYPMFCTLKLVIRDKWSKVILCYVFTNTFSRNKSKHRTWLSKSCLLPKIRDTFVTFLPRSVMIDKYDESVHCKKRWVSHENKELVKSIAQTTESEAFTWRFCCL